jgi:O-Antigen ligase
MKSFPKKISALLFLIILIMPFQTPIFHKTLKKLSLAVLPPHLPAYFPHKIAFFPTEFLLLALLVLFRKKLAPFFWSGPSKYLSLLFAAGLISLMLSPTSTYLLMYTRFIEAALIIVLFHAISTTFDADAVIPFMKRLAYLFFFLSLFESGVALLQFFFQKSLGLKCIGECDLKNYTYPMAHAFRFIFDTRTEHHALIRASGTFPHPNIFGGFLFCALLNTFYLFFTQRKKKLLLCGILIQIPALLLSFSRSALIACVCSTLLYFILSARNPDQRKSVWQLSLALTFLGAVCLIFFYPQVSARGGILNYNRIAQGADSERLIYQNIALGMIKEHPLLGVGMNNFQIASPPFFPEGRTFPSRVHNIYLLIAAETGLIGAAFFLLFLFSLLKKVRCAIASREGVLLLSLFMGLLFIGGCDFYLLCTPHGQILFFTAAALFHVASKIPRGDRVGRCEQRVGNDVLA